VLTFKDVGKMYDDLVVLSDVTLGVERGERIAIIGPNGIGKSTLLKICMDEVTPDTGAAQWGYEAHVGYFAQDTAGLFSTDVDLQTWLWDQFPGENIGFVRGKLAEVLFSKDEADKRISALSGGEKARLVFCMLGARKPNVLVLDEPTNHLDLEGISALAKGLQSFDGTLLFVSHNRWFVEQLATRIVELSADGVFEYHGTYSEYVAHKKADHLDSAAVLEEEGRARRAKKRARKQQKRDQGSV